MPHPIRPVRVNHMNIVVEDFEASMAHFRDLYGAEFLADLDQREWHACLISIGGVIFEPFVPHAFLLHARHGPFHLGLEYQADMDQVRQAIAGHGLRIARDIGVAVHTHPQDGLGVAFEFYGGYFHDNDWPLLGGRMKPAAWWRDEHPLGLTGLKGWSLAVHQLAPAQAFLQSFLGAEVVYEEERPAVAARAVGLRVADDVIDLIAPVGAGEIADHLRRHGEGIRATQFGVRDLEQARRYFAARSVALVPGVRPGSLAVPAEANRGIIFEFCA